MKHAREISTKFTDLLNKRVKARLKQSDTVENGDPEKGKHPYLRMENLKSVRDSKESEEIKAFLLFFFKTDPFNTKNFSQVFNQLIALSNTDFVPSNSNSSHSSSKGLEAMFDQYVEEEGGEAEIEDSIGNHADEQSDRPDMGSNQSLTEDTDTEDTDVEALREQEVPNSHSIGEVTFLSSTSALSKSEGDTVKLFLTKNNKHLCFLFHTKDKEYYNILLKIKYKVNHNFFLSLDSEDEDQVDELDRKGKKKA